MSMCIVLNWKAVLSRNKSYQEKEEREKELRVGAVKACWLGSGEA